MTALLTAGCSNADMAMDFRPDGFTADELMMETTRSIFWGQD